MSAEPTKLNALYDAATTRLETVSTRMSREDFFDHLNADERFAVHVLNLNGQWLNGGLMQWFDNRYGTPETLEYLNRALARVGTPAAERVRVMLEKARLAHKTHGSASYSDDDEQDALTAVLDPLDSEYYDDLDVTFVSDCEAYAVKGGK